MNSIYFVRHSVPDFSIKEDAIRPLSEEGIRLCKDVEEFLKDKSISRCYSSPYKRSVDTIRGFAEKSKLNIELVDDFRERAVSNQWIDDFMKFARMQWEDFEYKLPHGESLKEVQTRNIRSLHNILEKYDGENIIIGTHGTALSTIINHYDSEWDFNCFQKIAKQMPLIIRMDFSGVELHNMEIVDMLQLA